MRIDLTGQWKMHGTGIEELSATIPGSVLGTLMAHNIIEDPFYQKNELKARELLKKDYSFVKRFTLTEADRKRKNYLCMESIDTIAKVFVNGKLLTELFDMHTPQKILLDNAILQDENEIRIDFTSPYIYVENYDDQGMFPTFAETHPKGPCIRKAHSMLGWDWGPDLGDMGIYRDIYILSTDLGYLESFRHTCHFLNDGKVRIEVEVNVEKLNEGTLNAKLTLTEDELEYIYQDELKNKHQFSFVLDNPKRWYPIGYGEQVLYNLDFELESNNEIQKEHYRIGIREVEFDHNSDEYGTNFGVRINGIPIFIKGANYIPQDSIIPRIDKSNVLHMLDLVKDFNHNVIRVWGGGYYPEPYFYDYCDENGILVWQDLMFACASYNMQDEHFKSLIIEETIANVKRFRHHASVFLIAGDNECEDGVNGHEPAQMENYRVMSLEVLVPLMAKLTDTTFLRTSPRSKELFQHQNDTEHYDTHYWGIWSDGLPLEEYQSIYPRMLSEVGHGSFPLLETVYGYMGEEEPSMESAIVEAHQKRPNPNLNKNILKFIERQYGIPKRFEDIVFLSHLMQAEAMKICAEHLRRNIGRCNGMIYWQLNDCWPGQSWSAIDYNFGIKALQYYSKKFFAPQLVSVDAADECFKIVVTNDAASSISGQVTYRYCNFAGFCLKEESREITVAGFGQNQVFELEGLFEENEKDTVLYVELRDKQGEVVSECYFQKEKDKNVSYCKPQISCRQLADFSLSVSTDTYTKNIYIHTNCVDEVLSDNYFHLLPGQEKVVTFKVPIEKRDYSIYSLNDVMNRI